MYLKKCYNKSFTSCVIRDWWPVLLCECCLLNDCVYCNYFYCMIVYSLCHFFLSVFCSVILVLLKKNSCMFCEQKYIWILNLKVFFSWDSALNVLVFCIKYTCLISSSFHLSMFALKCIKNMIFWKKGISFELKISNYLWLCSAKTALNSFRSIEVIKSNTSNEREKIVQCKIFFIIFELNISTKKSHEQSISQICTE